MQEISSDEILRSLNLTQDPLSQLELFVLCGIWCWRGLWDSYVREDTAV